ncbi:MAG: hypothetical protein AABW50_05390 [Nanoarchaeota archaeon]
MLEFLRERYNSGVKIRDINLLVGDTRYLHYVVNFEYSSSEGEIKSTHDITTLMGSNTPYLIDGELTSHGKQINKNLGEFGEALGCAFTPSF